jgi:hypothetical protein
MMEALMEHADSFRISSATKAIVTSFGTSGIVVSRRLP